MYQVIFTNKALKSLKRIPVVYQLKIKDVSQKLAKDPFVLDLRKLESSYNATHRLRVGNYRLFLRINIESKIIEIADLERRTTQTYR